MADNHLSKADSTKLNLARKKRNRVIGLILFGVIVMFYLVTFVRIGGL